MPLPDRKIQPGIKPMDRLSILDAEKITLDNGIPAYLVTGGNQEVFKLDLIFNSGSADGDFPLIAFHTNKMLAEGTPNMTSAEISEKLDYYGATIKSYCDKDISGVTVYSLNKYADEMIDLFARLINESAFPEIELITLNSKQKQLFLVNQRKVRHVARENFFPLIFGKDKPYGQINKLEDFDDIELNAIKNYYREKYRSDNCFAIISGKVDDALISTINSKVGKILEPGFREQPKEYLEASLEPTDQLIERKDVLQSAIRIGRPLFNKLHPDYIPMKFVSTLLGGYFGSRLMSNIREDKGYTYGIGSNLVSLEHSGYFFIATEVGADVRKAAVEEIYAEIERLIIEAVSDKEIDLVKNYMTGSFMHSIDGPFALAEAYKNVLLFGLDQEYFDRMIDEIHAMTTGKVQELAAKYLKKEDLFELIVGK
ncbi:MAG: insulinase family protein [Bacteroidales bacterium]|nr:insulinase family protein [Bacteroidales bacterium]MCF8387134.1 insulinase family protein [Bacteroidales bacterium]MCF8398871.1 insulinase family protein [Bacteroidales bacterium]